MIKEITFEDYLLIIKSIERPLEFREGQWSMIILYHIRPDLASQNVGRQHRDPYYITENLPNFYAWLQSNWK